MRERLRGSIWLTLLVGGCLPLVTLIIDRFWLTPKTVSIMHQRELLEYRVSRLYAPLVVVTAGGQFSMTSDLVFYKVLDIMSEYGYLADDEVMNKYIEFLTICRFASYHDLTQGSSLRGPLPREVVLEIIKQRRPPLKWTPSSLERAIRVEKEFYRLLFLYYRKAKRSLGLLR